MVVLLAVGVAVRNQVEGERVIDGSPSAPTQSRPVSTGLSRRLPIDNNELSIAMKICSLTTVTYVFRFWRHLTAGRTHFPHSQG